jgi:nucleoside-diphosphate-sugar epimerase
VHGPGSVLWTERLGRLLRAGRIGDLGGQGQGLCNLSYIDDLIEAIVAALRVPGLGGEVFNVTDATTLTWNEFLIRFAQAIGISPARRISRGRMAVETKLVGPALVVARRLSRQGRFGPGPVPDAITPSLAALFRRELGLSPDKADALLKVRRTPLEAALDASARWLADERGDPAIGMSLEDAARARRA